MSVMLTTWCGNISLCRLKLDLDQAIKGLEGKSERRAEKIDHIFAAFAHGEILKSPLDPQDWKPWLTKKLKELEAYDKELYDAIE